MIFYSYFFHFFILKNKIYFKKYNRLVETKFALICFHPLYKPLNLRVILSLYLTSIQQHSQQEGGKRVRKMLIPGQQQHGVSKLS
jgi:hypothetical protein